jgi:hypothetical protein
MLYKLFRAIIIESGTRWWMKDADYKNKISTSALYLHLKSSSTKYNTYNLTILWVLMFMAL